ncbi:MAG: DUF4102 domain-containing protein [Deltaproteobacteria bacterium]|nr:DUF4102 domain-containing protein [Deltaproteobacteria bacterium]
MQYRLFSCMVCPMCALSISGRDNMNVKIKLTKIVVDKLPATEKGKQADFYDAELPAFGIRVSHSSKVYFVRKRINGKMTRVTLGRHGVMTADDARNEAKDAFNDLRKGVDINREKAKARERGITLQRVFEDYLTARPDMRPRTIAVDNGLLNCHLSDWLKKPIKEITDDMVKRRHLAIAKKSGANTGNNAMRLFRRLHRFAGRSLKEKLDRDLVKDALDGQWFKVSRRQTCLKEHELPTWNKAVRKISNPAIRDYLQLLIFTGLRKNEGLTLRWEDVDMEGKTFTIREGISKNRKPHPLPMSDIILEIFQRRLDARENEFVFPGTGKSRHLRETNRQVVFIEHETAKILNGAQNDEELAKLIKEKPADKIKQGIRFCLHDLRRTFASIAEGAVSYSVLKRLMNHSDKDVTQGYIILSVDKLRPHMQQVTDSIRGMLTEKQPGKVIPIGKARSKKTSSANK